MEMIITKISQELFIEAVKTLPIRCSDMDFRMFAVEPDFPKKEGSEERYVARCLENDIIPCSLIEFEYRHDKDLFVPEHFRIYHNRFSESIQKLLEGAKFNELEIKASVDPVIAFENFRKENGLLDLMLSKGYNLSNGYLEDYHNNSLIFSSGYFDGKIFELTLSDELDDEHKGKLVGWFKELEDVYQHQQGRLIQ